MINYSIKCTLKLTLNHKEEKMTQQDVLTFEAICLKFITSLIEDFVELCKSVELHQQKNLEQEVEVDPTKIWLDGTIPDGKTEIDPYEAPKALFWAIWNEIKMECYKKRIYIDEETAINFFSKQVPFSYVWKKLIQGDEDFTTFRTMKLKDDFDKKFKEADEATRAEIQKQEMIFKILSINLEQSKKVIPADRILKPFNDELAIVIDKLERAGLKIDVHRLKALISRVVPDSFPNYLLNLVDQYEHRLNNIKPIAITAIVEDEEELEEITDLIELIEEPMTIKEMEIDPKTKTLVLAEKRYAIGLGGLRDAIESLMAMPMYKPMDYKNKLKDLLSKVRIYCRDNDKSDGLIKIIHELEKHYQKLHLKNYEAKIKNEKAMKITFTYTTLQLMHASMAENMSFGFMGKGGKVTIQ